MSSWAELSVSQGPLPGCGEVQGSARVCLIDFERAEEGSARGYEQDLANLDALLSQVSERGEAVFAWHW